MLVVGGREDLAIQRDGSDPREERLALPAAHGDLMPRPQLGEFRAVLQQRLDQLTHVGVVAPARPGGPKVSNHGPALVLVLVFGCGVASVGIGEPLPRRAGLRPGAPAETIARQRPGDVDRRAVGANRGRGPGGRGGRRPLSGGAHGRPGLRTLSLSREP